MEPKREMKVFSNQLRTASLSVNIIGIMIHELGVIFACMHVVGEFSFACVLVANEMVVRFSSVFLHAFAIVIRGANIHVSCFEVKSGIHHVCGVPVFVFMYVGGCASNVRDQTS